MAERLAAGSTLVSMTTTRLTSITAALAAALCAIAGSALAGATGGTSHSYGWPVRPFDRQHPVRSTFGDPRGGTLHFGIDVVAPDGAAVYATVDGTVVPSLHPDEVVHVRARDGSVFCYWHLVPVVRPGVAARAYVTVLGHVRRGYEHVHFSEYRGGRYLNPLRPGGLGPYRDATPPAIRSLAVERDGVAVAGSRLTGAVDLVVDASDTPSLPVPGRWSGLPVSPAWVGWRVVTGRGRAVTPWHTGVDFRGALPASFAAVYADGTRQNRPHRPGEYHYRLATRWDTRALPDGRYVLEAKATDSAGNVALARLPVVVTNGV